MKRTLVFLLALIMIPLFLGTLCPCAMAAPSTEVTIHKMPCQGCCPEMNASPECQSAVSAPQVLSSLTKSFKVSNVLKALSPGESRGIAINRRTLVPAGDEPSFFGHPLPLYLAINVLRI